MHSSASQTLFLETARLRASAFACGTLGLSFLAGLVWIAALGASLANAADLTTSSANTSAEQAAFRAEALKIPQDLLAKGYDDIGAVHLRDLINQISNAQLPVVFEPSIHVPAPNGLSRIWTAWERKNGVAFVFVSQKGWTALQDHAQEGWFPENYKAAARQILALDAFISALGYNNDQYQTSISLWFLNQDQALRLMTRPQVKRSLSTAQEVVFRQTANDYGAGDLMGLLFKQSIVNAAVDREKTEPSAKNQIDIFYAFFTALAGVLEMGYRGPVMDNMNSDGTSTRGSR